MNLIVVDQEIEMNLIVVVHETEMTSVVVAQGIEMTMIGVAQGIEMILIVVDQGIGMSLIAVAHETGMDLRDVVRETGMSLSHQEAEIMDQRHLVEEEEGKEEEMKIGGGHHKKGTGGLIVIVRERGKGTIGPEDLWMMRGPGGEMIRKERGDHLRQGGVGRMSIGGGMLIMNGAGMSESLDKGSGQGEVAEVMSEPPHNLLARNWTRRWMRKGSNW